jgi:predicted PurR-regulated permease PerM
MLKEGSPSKYFFIGLIALVAIIAVIITFPFLTSIIAGCILAFVFYPLYSWMQRRIIYKGLAAFITAIIILLLVTIPTVMLFNTLTKESHYLYIRAKQQLTSGELIESRCYEDTFICNTINNANQLLRDETVKSYLFGLLNDVLAFFTKKISGVILSLPKIILHLLVVLFTCYYVLKDGKELLKRIERVAPLKVHHQEQIIKQFGDVTKAIIYGSFLVALVQGTLGAFGLWMFGIKSFIWWGIVMTFFAVIPFIGTWVVWLPASAFLALSGYLQSETGLIWRGAGLFFYGLLIISTVDNILKPVIVAERARVHPLLILIGILGGLFVFGLIGLIIGPLMLALLQTLLQIYEREKEPHAGEPEPDILGHKHKKTHGTER